MTAEPFSTSFPEFPYVILDADGVCDRVATEDEARAYVAEQPGTRYEREAVAS